MSEYIAEDLYDRCGSLIGVISHGELIRCKNCSWHYGTICRRDSTFPWKDDDYCSKAEVEE